MQYLALAVGEEDMAETRGQRLKVRREQARIAQRDLAARARISVRSLQNLEQGLDATRNMRRTADAVEEALAAMIQAMPEEQDHPRAPARRLRAVEARLRDGEEIYDVETEEVIPGVRRMTIVLLDSDAPIDEATRRELERIHRESLPDANNR